MRIIAKAFLMINLSLTLLSFVLSIDATINPDQYPFGDSGPVTAIYRAQSVYILSELLLSVLFFSAFILTLKYLRVHIYAFIVWALILTIAGITVPLLL